MSGSRPVVELRNVRKDFGDVTAVDEIDLDILEGEFFSLLGPSGCGKTTTLRIISGLESPTAGTVSLFGTDVTETSPQERETNLVFQNLALFPHMTVEQNIRFGLRHEDLTESETEDRIEEMLRVVDMAGFEPRNVTQLSGGQQQRIALARSLAKQPAVLLLDEPLASLDRKLRQHMQFELKEIQENLGTTFFYVTHDQEVAMTMSDRMAVMRDGDIVQVGTPEEIYEAPSSSFVAEFIGDANFVSGRIEADGDDGVFVGGGIRLPAHGAPPVENARLLLRPENIAIGDTAADSEITFDARITDRIHQGHTINFNVALENDVEIEVRQKALDVAAGDQVRVGFDLADYTIITD